MPVADSTLGAIKTKVRRITRSPGAALLSNTDLEQYINTFVVYDIPEHLRLFNLRKTLTFYTSPYVDVYPTNTVNAANPLYNFVNRYLTIHPPIYIAGYEAYLSQSREEFFNMYPKRNNIASIGTTGDGVTTNFSGTLPSPGTTLPPTSTSITPILADNVIFDSQDANYNALTLVAITVYDAVTGLPTQNANLYSFDNLPIPASLPPTVVTPANTINYVTKIYNITFPTAPAAGATINSQTVLYQPSLPTAVLFYDGTFTLRPVPDQSYAVNLEVYMRPTDLLDNALSPQLEEWWQYIAYGASKKVFEDRNDLDSVQMIMPEFKKQEDMILRRTLVQIANSRSATIYTGQTSIGAGPNSFWGGSF